MLLRRAGDETGFWWSKDWCRLVVTQVDFVSSTSSACVVPRRRPDVHVVIVSSWVADDHLCMHSDDWACADRQLLLSYCWWPRVSGKTGRALCDRWPVEITVLGHRQRLDWPPRRALVSQRRHVPLATWFKMNWRRLISVARGASMAGHGTTQVALLSTRQDKKFIKMWLPKAGLVQYITHNKHSIRWNCNDWNSDQKLLCNKKEQCNTKKLILSNAINAVIS